MANTIIKKELNTISWIREVLLSITWLYVCNNNTVRDGNRNSAVNF